MMAVGASLYFGDYLFLNNGDRQIDAIVDLLRERLNFLDIRDADLVAFAHDYQRRELTEKAEVVDRLGPIGAVYRFYDRLNNSHMVDELRDFEDYTANLFLLSSDFFWHGADESRTVSYLSLYGTVETACGQNPFARF